MVIRIPCLTQYVVQEKRLSSDGPWEEGDYNLLNSFNSDGFTVGTDAGGNAYVQNETGVESVAWCWNAGDTTETITAGDLNSSVYDQSQTWSTTNFNSNSNTSSSYPVTRVFDGNINQGEPGASVYNGVCFPSTPGYIQFDFTEFSTATSVEVFLSTYGSGWSLEINGIPVSGVATQNIPNHSVTVPVSGFTSIKWTTVDGNNFIGVAGIKVDGKLLVDSGVSVPAVPSIGSEVRANPAAGFSVVTYTGTGSNGTIGHGLGVSPSCLIITKNRTIPGLTGSFTTLHLTQGRSCCLIPRWLNLCQEAVLTAQSQVQHTAVTFWFQLWQP